MSSLYYLMYLTAVQPFDTKGQNRIEYFNELCILVASCHLIIFTDFVPDRDIKEQFGFSIMVFTVFNIAVNMAFMVILTIRKVKTSFKAWLIKRGYIKAPIDPPARSRNYQTTKMNFLNNSKTLDLSNFEEPQACVISVGSNNQKTKTLEFNEPKEKTLKPRYKSRKTGNYKRKQKTPHISDNSCSNDFLPYKLDDVDKFLSIESNKFNRDPYQENEFAEYFQKIK